MLGTWATFSTSDTMVHHQPMEDSIVHGDFLCLCRPAVRAAVQEDGYTVVWLFTHNKMKEEV